jgi:hypothetical protein
MNYVLQSVASEDMVQLFSPPPSLPGTPVTGLVDTDVTVKIQKQGEAGFTTKVIVPSDWVDRGGGNYSIQFSAADFDTLGIFRYRLEPAGATPFIVYEDLLNVVETIPTVTQDPPTINSQTGSPPGLTPDPVERGATLTINGTNLEGTSAVTVGGVLATITATGPGQVQVTVPLTAPLGEDVEVELTTPGGSTTGTVEVVLAGADIPGDGMINLYGYIHLPGTGQRAGAGIGVEGRVLDMPNLHMGVMWTDDVVSVSTDSTGRWDMFLPREVRVEISIPRTRYRRVFTTPDQPTANIVTEIP